MVRSFVLSVNSKATVFGPNQIPTYTPLYSKFSKLIS